MIRGAAKGLAEGAEGAAVIKGAAVVGRTASDSRE